MPPPGPMFRELSLPATPATALVPAERWVGLVVSPDRQHSSTTLDPGARRRTRPSQELPTRLLSGGRPPVGHCPRADVLRLLFNRRATPRGETVDADLVEVV